MLENCLDSFRALEWINHENVILQVPIHTFGDLSRLNLHLLQLRYLLARNSLSCLQSIEVYTGSKI